LVIACGSIFETFCTTLRVMRISLTSSYLPDALPSATKVFCITIG
jgi:hypothetical protein